jgi:uncharacterized membrane protein
VVETMLVISVLLNVFLAVGVITLAQGYNKLARTIKVMRAIQYPVVGKPVLARMRTDRRTTANNLQQHRRRATDKQRVRSMKYQQMRGTNENN